ncbi:MAG: hypothetical protein N2044_01215 [Cyclobacteriaceae bacterium]|nr:hypothetical protein [Cyclobacteriaceae bacterium]MCX7636442.1 hypothetical protein [Cyclobacteriaceae bacterium]MDW8330761.1 hypothetical protein [Cyclobacteriaceae bacterium]
MAGRDTGWVSGLRGAANFFLAAALPLVDLAVDLAFFATVFFADLVLAAAFFAAFADFFAFAIDPSVKDGQKYVDGTKTKNKGF